MCVAEGADARGGGQGTRRQPGLVAPIRAGRNLRLSRLHHALDESQLLRVAIGRGFARCGELQLRAHVERGFKEAMRLLEHHPVLLAFPVACAQRGAELGPSGPGRGAVWCSSAIRTVHISV